MGKTQYARLGQLALTQRRIIGQIAVKKLSQEAVTGPPTPRRTAELAQSATSSASKPSKFSRYAA